MAPFKEKKQHLGCGIGTCLRLGDAENRLRNSQRKGSPHMCYSLNSSRALYRDYIGSVIEVIKGDTRSTVYCTYTQVITCLFAGSRI